MLDRPGLGYLGVLILHTMPSLLAYFAPLALLLPFGAVEEARSPVLQDSARFGPDEAELSVQRSAAVRNMLVGEWAVQRDSAHQVRIERRITVRVVPLSSAPRQSLMAEIPRPPQPTRFEERKMGKCLAIDDITGVQTGSGDRLVLFLRDRRMVSARLEKACRARDFYSGFYLERNEDGKICVDRDKLLSRAGANCELDRLRELVPAAD